jgi:hypothetical protein
MTLTKRQRQHEFSQHGKMFRIIAINENSFLEYGKNLKLNNHTLYSGYSWPSHRLMTEKSPERQNKRLTPIYPPNTAAGRLA